MVSSIEYVQELAHDFVKVAELAGFPLSPDEITCEYLPAPHKRPSSLPAGYQVVYAFLLGSKCLKVGKAGPKSQARFISQHYGFNAGSTLARSVFENRGRLGSIFRSLHETEHLSNLAPDEIGQWLEKNTSRFHVFLPAQTGSLILNLLEGFMQCRLQPVFEGKSG